MKPRVVGHIDEKTVQLLGISAKPGTPILLGDTNYRHMQESHPEAFEKYFCHLEDILAAPDYVNLNPRDGSIKYLKQIDEYVVVGVRVSGRGNAYARTIFVFEDWKFQQYSRGGYLKEHSKRSSPSTAPTENQRQGD